LKGQQRFDGTFNNELDAAKRVNQLCEELGIPLHNPTISEIPNEKYQKKEKTSLYKGVSWHRERKKWRVQIRLKGGKIKSGGYFNTELNAAKRVNQLCEELCIPLQNPTINAIPNQEYRTTKCLIHESTQTESTVQNICNEKVKVKVEEEENLLHEIKNKCENNFKKRDDSCEKKEKLSQYKGVTWYKNKKR